MFFILLNGWICLAALSQFSNALKIIPLSCIHLWVICQAFSCLRSQCWPHCELSLSIPVVSPAMGHWGTCPPRLPTISFLVHFGVNPTTNYRSIVYICEISSCRCQQLTALSISTAVVTKILVIEQLLHPALKFAVSAPFPALLLATNPGDITVPFSPVSISCCSPVWRLSIRYRFCIFHSCIFYSRIFCAPPSPSCRIILIQATMLFNHVIFGPPPFLLPERVPGIISFSIQLLPPSLQRDKNIVTSWSKYKEIKHFTSKTKV